MEDIIKKYRYETETPLFKDMVYYFKGNFVLGCTTPLDKIVGSCEIIHHHHCDLRARLTEIKESEPNHG